MKYFTKTAKKLSDMTRQEAKEMYKGVPLAAGIGGAAGALGESLLSRKVKLKRPASYAMMIAPALASMGAKTISNLKKMNKKEE